MLSLWLAMAGEIIPQALCSRFGLQIGAYSAWFVHILLWVVGIVSFPISKVLDYLLGSEHGVRRPVLHGFYQSSNIHPLMCSRVKGWVKLKKQQDTKCLEVRGPIMCRCSSKHQLQGNQQQAIWVCPWCPLG